MGVSSILVGSILFLLFGYLFYARFIQRQLGLGEEQVTPAHRLSDGVDYVPARAPILLGHHFASIAGAAPIIGPVLAAQFGWLPVLAWLLVGSVFLGAVHDYTALVVSIRHDGRSIGMVIEEYLGHTGKSLFLVFVFATLGLVIAVFIQVVAKNFVGSPEVATASLLFILLAVGFGVSVYRMGVNFVIASVIGVLLLGLSLYLGTVFPFPRLFQDPEVMDLFWRVVLLIYVFIASVTPVNILLQPRDYLNSFLLYAILLLSVIAILVSPPELKGEAFHAFHVDKLGSLFPILFVTVACGAISGFHSIVASGTTAKQLNREKDARLVGYGAMLIESLLAVIALITAIAFTRGDYLKMLYAGGQANPVAVFSAGVAQFLEALSIQKALGVSFAGLAVSAFALTTLDTATRLERFTIQEFFLRRKDPKGRPQPILAANRFLSTGLAVLFSTLTLFSGQTTQLWKLFGAANQLLAALSLMAVTAWLYFRKRKCWYTLVPMGLMYGVTVAALIQLFVSQVVLAERTNWLLAPLIVILFVLALLLAYNFARRIRNSAGSRP